MHGRQLYRPDLHCNIKGNKKTKAHLAEEAERERETAKRWKNIPGVDVARLFANPAALFSTMFTRNRKKCTEKEHTKIMSHSVC